MENKYLYIIDLFNRIYHLTGSEYDLHYGIDQKSKIQIKQGKTAFFETREKYNTNNVIWKEWKNTRIPFLFDDDEAEILSLKDGNIIIHFDIIASSFFFLSNWQELGYEYKNDLGRFPFEESIQYKLGIMDRPVVNYYFDILKDAIEKAYPVNLGVKLWQDKPFCTFVSHDIDTCETAWLQGGYRALLKGEIGTTMKLLYLKLMKKDGWFNFDEILSLEKEDNIRSTFFFLGRKGKYGKYRNSDYNVRESKFKKVFAKIEENHSEVGIHGSLGTCNNPVRYNEDIQKFDRKIRGNRFHFLEFKVPDTIEVLENAGIEFDSTFGFAEHYGFRNGICFPFLLYNIKADKPSGVLEIPMVLMDGTLQNTRYMNVEKDQIEPKIRALVAEVKKFNGLFTVLWHNTHFSDYKYKGWKKIFRSIISICKENNSLFLNGSDISKKYRS
jgi:hypothetical protein